MTLRSFSLLAGALVLATQALAIDLTPRYAVVESDGAQIRRPYFADGDVKYAVTIDGGTELVEFEGSALFNFTKLPHAVMRLRQSPMKPEVPFDELNLPRYREIAKTLLIAGAEKPVLEQEVDNVLPVNDWRSHKFIYSYELAGAKMKESITFLDLNDKDQVVLQIRGVDADFSAVTARGEDIIRRWHRLRLDLEVKGN